MSTLDIFKKWFKIVTKTQLNQSDMNSLIKELLPGYSFRRSGHGPRSIKYIYDYDKVVFENGENKEVGMQALRMAANTEYKKAILDAHNTKEKINDLLAGLKENLSKFSIDITVDNGEIDILLRE